MISLLIFCCISATVFADDDHFRSSYFINAENRRLAAQMPKRVYFDSVLSCSHACLKIPGVSPQILSSGQVAKEYVS